MSKFSEACAVLETYISPMNARAILTRAVRAEGLAPETLSSSGLRRCSAALRRGAALFVSPSQLERAMEAINSICGSDSMLVEQCVLELRGEHDIADARARARRICTTAQASAFCTQKIATIVSELARNVVMYAGMGSIEIVPSNTRPKKIRICATDNGPGISNLDEILSGRYRSRTGMGRGLMGIKRLADHFDVETDRNGTRVVAEVLV